MFDADGARVSQSSGISRVCFESTESGTYYVSVSGHRTLGPYRLSVMAVMLGGRNGGGSD